MKKTIFKYLLSVLVLLVASCDTTDLKPVDIISEEGAFATPTNVELSVVGMYDRAQSGFYGGDETNDRGYIFGAAHVEMGDMRGEDFVLINVFYDLIFRSTFTTSAPNLVNYWENGFRTINIANLVMEGVTAAVENGVISEEKGNEYLGEARTVRAMTYHTLLIHFARPYLDGNGSNPGLPIFTAGVNGADEVTAVLETSRSSVADTYAFILDDLNFAEANLPVERDVHNVTRAVKAAAVALKTRVYSHMGNWAKVIEEGNKLLNGTTVGTYALGASVDTPWEDNASSESIFSMEMGINDHLNVNAELANMIGSPGEGARGEYAISPIIWNQDFWHPDDLRRSVTVKESSGLYYTHKFRDYANSTDWVPVIRLAEVVLSVAEAESRAGDGTRALTLLNSIRDRAISGTMTSYVAGDFATAVDRTRAILQERRIELLGEGERWSDIHRLAKDPDFSLGGIPMKMQNLDLSAEKYSIGTPATGTIAAIPYEDHRYLWPIPQSETTRNPILQAEQNPGW
jgi:hypothetical protein